MDLSDRLFWLLVGCIIGFVVGYIVRYLQELIEERHQVDKSVKRTRDEAGLSRHPVLMNALLFVVVVMTVWAAFASQKATNELEATQASIAKITACNQEYLGLTIIALNERTTYTAAQVGANIELQQEQAQFLERIFSETATDSVQRQALMDYVEALNKFVRVSEKIEEFEPYPTDEALDECLRN